MRYRTTWSRKTDPARAAALALLAAAAWAVCAVASAQAPPAPLPPPDLKHRGKDYAPFPAPDSGYVTDLAHLLTADQQERIERRLWETESRTGVEIAVVTVESIRDYPGAPSGSIESFARGLFDRYGIGNLPENKGVLLLVARKDREARIELGAGYGRGRDADAEKIMSEVILPSFRKDDYAGGIARGVDAIMGEFAGVRVRYNWPLILTALAVPVVALVAYSLFRSGKRGWGWVCVGLLIVLILALIRLVLGTLDRMPRGSSSSWSAGGFGGSFGGGFSGGGGATGRW